MPIFSNIFSHAPFLLAYFEYNQKHLYISYLRRTHQETAHCMDCDRFCYNFIEKAVYSHNARYCTLGEASVTTSGMVFSFSLATRTEKEGLREISTGATNKNLY